MKRKGKSYYRAELDRFREELDLCLAMVDEDRRKFPNGVGFTDLEKLAFAADALRCIQDVVVHIGYLDSSKDKPTRKFLAEIARLIVHATAGSEGLKKVG